MTPIRIELPLRLGRGMNIREHYYTRAKRVRAEREAVGWAILQRADRTRPVPPLVVTMTRIAPSSGLDDDNLTGSLKGVRDAVAEWLGIDDGKSSVRYACNQERGPWGVRIEITPTVTAPVLSGN